MNIEQARKQSKRLHDIEDYQRPTGVSDMSEVEIDLMEACDLAIELHEQVIELEAWREKAFAVHNNLDLDIEFMERERWQEELSRLDATRSTTRREG